MLLMFGVGLHFSLDDLLSVKKTALPGAVVQIAVATAMGVALTHWWGSLMAGIVFGLALSVASTGSRELFTLCVVAAALGIAYGSVVLFGVSCAPGAFFGGMVLRESALSYRAAEESLLLREHAVVILVGKQQLANSMVRRVGERAGAHAASQA